MHVIFNLGRVTAVDVNDEVVTVGKVGRFESSHMLCKMHLPRSYVVQICCLHQPCWKYCRIFTFSTDCHIFNCTYENHVSVIQFSRFHFQLFYSFCSIISQANRENIPVKRKENIDFASKRYVQSRAANRASAKPIRI